MLHGLDQLLDGGPVSDIDVVVRIEPDNLVAITKKTFVSRGLFPLVAWPYDLAGTTTVFYSLLDASQGVQLDFLHDVAGSGRYGLRSDNLLALSTSHRQVPTITEPARLVYLWRKRSRKQQWSLLRDLREEAKTVKLEQLVDASLAITGSAEVALELVDDNRSVSKSSLSHPWLRTRRIATRLRSPIGFWAHIANGAVASQVAARFGSILPHAIFGEVPTSSFNRRQWYLKSVLPIRLKPGIYVSFGRVPDNLRPDLILDSVASVDDAAARCVAAMSDRF